MKSKSKVPHLTVERTSPCGNKKKIYYFSVTTHSYPSPSITFTDYEYLKLIDGKWKVIQNYSAVGHPSNLKEFQLDTKILKLAHKQYLKFIEKYLIIHTKEGSYVTGSSGNSYR